MRKLLDRDKRGLKKNKINLRLAKHQISLVLSIKQTRHCHLQDQHETKTPKILKEMHRTIQAQNTKVFIWIKINIRISIKRKENCKLIHILKWYYLHKYPLNSLTTLSRIVHKIKRGDKYLYQWELIRKGFKKIINVTNSMIVMLNKAIKMKDLKKALTILPNTSNLSLLKWKWICKILEGVRSKKKKKLQQVKLYQ